MSHKKGKETHYRACNICEAICGLVITRENNKVVSIKGDKKDPLSKGHICPKAVALQDIYNDPDRLRKPVKKTADGWKEISWSQAFDEVSTQLKRIQKTYGNNAAAVYQGNPTVHNLEAMLYAPLFVRSLRTKNRYSATSVDQLPEQLVSLLMFGHSLLVPLPDIDRTDYLIIFGANPVVSNGSLMTAPGIPKRLKAIRERGGKIAVIDPRKTETSAIADTHIYIKPGTDVLMLLSMLHVVFKESLHNMADAANYTHGIEKIEQLVSKYPPESTAKMTGVDAGQIEKLVREFCQAKTASCYGRIGVSTQQYGTLSQWLINVFNIVTGTLDKVGGTMFSQPAFDVLEAKKENPSLKKRKGFADNYTRVRKLPDFNGEFPVVALAEEISTQGEGRIRALVTNSGNPVSSTPNSTKLDKALTKLDFMVSIDFYINETTRHANIILPPPSALERPHYDIVFHALAVQDTARFSSLTFKPPRHQKTDTDIFLELSWRMQSKNWSSKFSGWIKKTIIKQLGCEWVVNQQLKKGPYAQSHNLDLNLLKKNPHGIDLGALKPCLPQRLFTADKTINLAPDEIIEDIGRLEKMINDPSANKTKDEFDLLLIGRRNPRTNNSWLHNSYRMVKGKKRCLAFIHPQDAQQRNLKENDLVTVTSRVGSIQIEIQITEDIMPGVISIPHGWGHDMDGVKLSVATEHAGVNTNILTDDYLLDAISGNAALNGVPISVVKA